MPNLIARLSRVEIRKGMTLCLTNARALLREARDLARLRHYERSFALAVLALEETGKVVLLTILSHSDRLDLDDRQANALWKRYRDHRAKTSLILDHHWKGVLYVRKRKRLPKSKGRALFERLLHHHRRLHVFMRLQRARALDSMKLRSLYVDHVGGRFVLPPSVPAPVVRSLIVIAASAIDDASALRDSFRRSKTDRLADAIITTTYRSPLLRQLLAEITAG